jgi:hypothetical protein
MGLRRANGTRSILTVRFISGGADRRSAGRRAAALRLRQRSAHAPRCFVLVGHRAILCARIGQYAQLMMPLAAPTRRGGRLRRSSRPPTFKSPKLVRWNLIDSSVNPRKLQSRMDSLLSMDFVLNKFRNEHRRWHLSHPLTFCAWCGRVRFAGRWLGKPRELEVVAQARRHATSGICPSCFAEVERGSAS